MKRKLWAYCGLAGALVLSAGKMRAQNPDEAGPPAELLLAQAGIPGEGGPPPEMFGERMELLGFGGLHGGKVVTGKPFSATVTTTQTLADGNQITRTSNIYRDPQGRVRREVTLPGGSNSLVMIHDVVGGKEYLLRRDQKVAYVMAGHGGKGGPNGPGNGGPGGSRRGMVEANVQKEQINGPAPMNFGVPVVGTQYTRIIPAGKIGNANAITIVSQRWYSPDLQIVVMSTHNDPRFGNTTYTMSNIVQTPPPADSLFTVPADYTVKEGGPRGMRRFHGGPPAGGAPAPPPPGI